MSTVAIKSNLLTVPDVSVVIPAYRAAAFIDGAIESALAQGGVSLEVLVVDDACPLHTGDAVRTRYAHDPRVRVMRLKANQGPSGARNAGFCASQGEWVAVLDADDGFDQGRLVRLLAAGRNRGADAVADNVRFYDAVNDALSEPQIADLKAPEWVDLHRLVARGHPLTGQLDYGLLKPIFRREYLRSMPRLYPTDVRHGEDFQFYMRLIAAGARFLVMPEPGYRWTLRSSGNSQTRADYLGQAAVTLALKNDPAWRDDTRVKALLEDRARALVRFHRERVERRFGEHLTQRRYVRVLAGLVRHPWLLKRLPITLE